MKAIELTAFDGIESLRETDVDMPRPGAGDVLVEVRAAGVQYADFELARGNYPAARPLPYVIGFEVAGVVVEVGPGVEGIAAGDRIVSIVNGGGLAEYAVVVAAYAAHIPAEVSFAEATAVLSQGMTAYALTSQIARVGPRDRVLIQAAVGGVGIFLTQLVREAGVQQIVALAGSPAKLAVAARLGADAALDYTRPGWGQQALDATDGEGFDVVFNAVSGDVADESFRLLAPYGRFVVYGSPNLHDTFGPDHMHQLIFKSLSILGFGVNVWTPEQMVQACSTLLGKIASGEIEVVVDRILPLSDVRTAFAALAGRSTIGKVVLAP